MHRHPGPRSAARRAVAVAAASVIVLAGAAVPVAADVDPARSPASQESSQEASPAQSGGAGGDLSGGSSLPFDPLDLYADQEPVRLLQSRLDGALSRLRAAERELRVAQAAADTAAVRAAWAFQAARNAAADAVFARSQAQTAQQEFDAMAAQVWRDRSLVTPMWDADTVTDVLHEQELAASFTETLAAKQEAALRAARDAAAARSRAASVLADALDQASAARDQAAGAVEAELLVRERVSALRDEQDRLRSRLTAVDVFVDTAMVPGALLAEASRLKDVRPFAPSAVRNANSRMGEWLASDRTVVPDTPRAWAVGRLAAFGWSLVQWPCLDRLWWHESGWRVDTFDAMQGQGFDPNRTWGIPQAYPASKMADEAAGGGPDWATNPATQINWGLTYIQRVYSSPCQAFEVWRERAATGPYGWY